VDLCSVLNITGTLEINKKDLCFNREKKQVKKSDILPYKTQPITTLYDDDEYMLVPIKMQHIHITIQR